MKYDIYTFPGVILFVFSVLTTSILLNPDREELSNYLNRKIDIAIFYGHLLAYILIYYAVVGLLGILMSGKIILMLIKLGGFAVWFVLIYMNLRIIYNLIKLNFKPVLNHRILDLIVYFTVAWLLLERLEISWMVIGVISTALGILIFIFNIRLIQYSKLIHMLPEPVDLYSVYLGFGIFSSLVGLQLVSHIYSENVFKGFIFLAYSSFLFMLWYCLKQLEPVVKQIE